LPISTFWGNSHTSTRASLTIFGFDKLNTLDSSNAAEPRSLGSRLLPEEPKHEIPAEPQDAKVSDVEPKLDQQIVMIEFGTCLALWRIAVENPLSSCQRFLIDNVAAPRTIIHRAFTHPNDKDESSDDV
jgi:hypothetical protein